MGKSFKNENKTIKGRFKEGDPGGPGRPPGQKNYLTLLEEALDKEAKKAGCTFWEKLAQWGMTNPISANAILKKFLPDMQFIEHKDSTPKVIIFKDARASDNGDGNGKDDKDIFLVKGQPKED